MDQREYVFKKKSTKRQFAKLFLQITLAHSKKKLDALKERIAKGDLEIFKNEIPQYVIIVNTLHL